MENISAYLKKFRATLFKGEESRRTVKEEIEKVVGVLLEERDVEIKGDTVFVNASPALKSELFLKKTALLKNIRERGIISVKELR